MAKGKSANSDLVVALIGGSFDHLLPRPFNEINLMIALIGGSFDPVHFGHLRPALELLESQAITQVRFIPCAVNPDKSEPVADAASRVEMLHLVASDKLHVDTREIVRGGVSYTLDTMLQLRTEVGNDTPLAFVLGADVAQTIDSWENVAQLSELVHLIVLQRPGADYQAPKQWQLCRDLEHLAKQPAGGCVLMLNPLLDISSTAIRAMIARNEQPRYMLPGVVWNYIRRKGLYGYGGSV